MPIDDPTLLERSGVPLSDMIETLRGELERAMASGKGKSVAFAVDKAELELKVAVSQTGKGGVGIAFWVVKADAAVEDRREFSHTFRLTLKPVSGETGTPINISALVAPAQAPGAR